MSWLGLNPLPLHTPDLESREVLLAGGLRSLILNSCLGTMFNLVKVKRGEDAVNLGLREVWSNEVNEILEREA